MWNKSILCAFALAVGVAGCLGDVPPTAVSFDLVARAGPDQVVECVGHLATPVTLDGSATEANGHSITLEWRGPFGTVTGLRPTVTLPMGRHEVILVVRGGTGELSTDVVVIDVVDTRAPEIHDVSATPSSLWPPNHKMVPVTIAVDASDMCDDAPACRITSVTSNEPSNTIGDGNTSPDWLITGPLGVELRAERMGPGSGRVYTITVQCTDASGNAGATRTVVVTVPHDQGTAAQVMVNAS
jgi:hypothetical protein